MRFVAPNVVTAIGFTFAALAIQRAFQGEYRTAAWWAMYCLLTDNIDGAVARRLGACSRFGAQFDSFADFFSFGVAPAAVLYSFFSNTPSAGWTDPVHHTLLSLLLLLFLLCVAARLARFNVTATQGQGYFVGFATTYIGGMLSASFVLALKYGGPAWRGLDTGLDNMMLLGNGRSEWLMTHLPWLILPASLSLVSTIRMPRAALTSRRSVDVLLATSMILGYALGLARRLPEYLVAGGLVYLLITVRYHLTTRNVVAVSVVGENPKVAT